MTVVSGGAGSYSDVGSKPYRLKKKQVTLLFFCYFANSDTRSRSSFVKSDTD